LIELKDLIVKFYADKVTSQANAIWDEKGLTNEDMDKWLNQKS
jgi:L-amino acid N-acyltransferase YncA